VTEYLSFVASLRGIDSGERRSHIDQAVEETSIQEVFYRPVSQCSKGYKQRVGLAGAILHRPDILIMDEPTEGLDPNQRVPIRELIRKMGSQRTVLLSTHVLHEVEETCDRLLIITRGRIVAQGTLAELQAHAHGSRHVDMEVEGEGVEKALARLRGVESVQQRDPVNGRQRYSLAVSEEAEVRPEIFKLAKQRNWVLWELHEEAARLEDLFHSLTATEPVVEE
jgi:ABC-2 type transport system ATP-binding protein